MNYRTLAIITPLVLLLVSLFWAYTSWAAGSVITSVRGFGNYTYCIRQIPLQPPGLNDGYAYRCEVWHGKILIQASTCSQDSWDIRTVSITVDSGRVVFHLDGYNIVGPYPGINTPDCDWIGAGHL